MVLDVSVHDSYRAECSVQHMQQGGIVSDHVGFVGQQVQQPGVRDVTPAMVVREVRGNMLFTRRKIAGTRPTVAALQLRRHRPPRPSANGRPVPDARPD